MLDDIETDGGAPTELGTEYIENVKEAFANNSSGGIEADVLQRRLNTYTNYRGKKLAIQLATAGFIYSGTSDKVICESCGVRLFNWIGNEDPLEEHRRYSTDCSFIVSKFPDGYNHTVSDGLAKAKESQNARYPMYSSYESRLKSFSGWPLKDDKQSPSIMAESGFFYIGSADRAKCFHCALNLRDWETCDFPPDVHKQWSPDCSFAKQLNIESMRQKVTEGKIEPSYIPEITDGSTSSFVPTSSNIETNTHDAKLVNDNNSKTGNTYKYSIPVQTVLEMGYTIDIIEKAIQNKKIQGKDIDSALELFEEVLKIE